MYQHMNEDAVFERLESLRRELESSRLMARRLRTWGRLLRDLLGRLTMRPPRRLPAPTHHSFEDTAASDAA
jgi:hypothetical protein